MNMQNKQMDDNAKQLGSRPEWEKDERGVKNVLAGYPLHSGKCYAE